VLHPILGATIDNAHKIKNNLYKYKHQVLCRRSGVFTVLYTCFLKQNKNQPLQVQEPCVQYCAMLSFPCLYRTVPYSCTILSLYCSLVFSSQHYFLKMLVYIQYTKNSTKIFGLFLFDFHVVLPALQYVQSRCRK
jgi:hypothetical protein